MNEDLRIMREVALKADAFYEKSKELGVLAASSLKGDKRSQITGLESICNSTVKVSDVCDFIKVRTARQEAWRQGDFGKQMLLFIEHDLAQRRGEVCAALSITDERKKQDVYMLLIREFVRQLAAQYEYSRKENPA